jgi:hypothetical protein
MSHHRVFGSSKEEDQLNKQFGNEQSLALGLQ